MAYPTPEQIARLPYRLYYGHWGLTASIGPSAYPEVIASAYFPVGNCGPFDPPAVRDRVFAELDAKARAALSERNAS